MEISKFPDVQAKGKFDCGFAKIQPLSIPGSMHDARHQYLLKNGAENAAKELHKRGSQFHALPTLPCGLSIDYKPANILHEIGSEHCHFAALDISNGFWTCPLAPEDQAKVAFTCNGQQWTCTHISQGFCNSPTMFHQALATSIDPVCKTIESDGSVILQYVDDILIAHSKKLI